MNTRHCVPTRRPTPMLVQRPSIMERTEGVSLSVSFPFRCDNQKNVRMHWRDAAHETKAHRVGTRSTLMSLWNAPFPEDSRWRVTLHRVSPRSMDSDNLQRAMSSMRDGVADFLGIDDGSKRIDWVYTQEKARAFGAVVTVERLVMP